MQRQIWLLMGVLCLALTCPERVSGQTTNPPKKDAPQPAASKAPPAYLAIVNLLIPPEAPDNPDATATPAAIDPEKAVLLFRWSAVSGGNKFKCRAQEPLPTPETPEKPVMLPYAMQDIDAILACAVDDKTPLRFRLDAIAHLVLLANDRHVKEASRYPRALTSKNETVRVAVLYRATITRLTKDKTPLIVRGQKAQIKITETRRSSRIATDLETFANVAARILSGARDSVPYVDPADTEGAPGVWLIDRRYDLTLQRSTMAIVAATKGEEGVLASDFAKTDLEAFLDAEKSFANADAQAKATAKLAEAARKIDCSAPVTLQTSIVNRLVCIVKTTTNPVAVRTAAATSLGELGQPVAILPLSEVVSDANAPADLRASATTAVVKLSAGSAGASAPAPRAATPSSGASTTMSVITGPGEHWYLSADVPLTKDTKFTQDAKTGAVTGVADPATSYLGVGFQFGDLQTRHTNPFLNLTLKLLVKASTRPMDSYGFALGLRGSYLKKFGLDFDAVSPFYSYISTRETPPDTATVTPSSTSRGISHVGGVSLNLDAAMAWLKDK